MNYLQKLYLKRKVFKRSFKVGTDSESVNLITVKNEGVRALSKNSMPWFVLLEIDCWNGVLQEYHVLLCCLTTFHRLVLLRLLYPLLCLFSPLCPLPFLQFQSRHYHLQLIASKAYLLLPFPGWFGSLSCACLLLSSRRWLVRSKTEAWWYSKLQSIVDFFSKA